MSRPEIAAAGVGAGEVRRRARGLVPGEADLAALSALLGELARHQPVRPEEPGPSLGVWDREAVEEPLEARIGGRGRAARAVVEQDPDGGLALEEVQRRLVAGLVLYRIRWQGDAGHPHRRLVEDRREGGCPGWQLGSSSGDVELEEVEPTVEGLGVERVDVQAVGEV